MLIWSGLGARDLVRAGPETAIDPTLRWMQQHAFAAPKEYAGLLRSLEVRPEIRREAKEYAAAAGLPPDFVGVHFRGFASASGDLNGEWMLK